MNSVEEVVAERLRVKVPTRRLGLAGLCVLALALAACGEEAADGPDASVSLGDDVATGDPADDATLEETQLRTALARFSAESDTQMIEFGDAARVRELSGDSFEGYWGSLDGFGAGSAFTDRARLTADIGVDLAAADYVVTVGQPPSALTVVGGGQDEQTVIDAATASGWSGEPVLTSETDLTQPVSVSAPKIAPNGTDVALGGTGSDPSSVAWDGSGSLADEPAIAALSSCLGDAVAALIVDGDPAPVAVGVRANGEGGTDGDDGVSVICVADATDPEAVGTAIEEAVRDGVTVQGRLYADYFSDVAVEVEDGVVHAVLDPTESLGITVVQMAYNRDLPGVEIGDASS